jgi:methylmalonyl-CoA decarboxylase subunit alpha
VTLRDRADELRRNQSRIRAEMGSKDRVDRIRAAGRLTIRDRIDKLVDPGSFAEVGTFARSERPEDKASSPGDGKIGGMARLNGRPIAVVGDDITVFRGSSSHVSSKRVHRITEQAMRNGHPLVYFGETGGARIPDTLGSEGFVKVQPDIQVAARGRAIPVASVICGHSFGGSSFKSAFSDYVGQVRGSCLAVTSPRVFEIATGEKIGFEELGGVDVHDRLTGQIDRAAETEAEAIEQVKAFLSYMPQNAWEEPARTRWDGNFDRDEAIYDLVPLRRTRGYDMRRVLHRLTDDGQFFELKPNFGRSAITALGRIAGRSVGFIASQTTQIAGALTPQSCDKTTAFICLCDAFNIPLIYLQDCPGFMVGREVEHGRILSRAITMIEAMAQCRVPRLTIVLRKAFGLAYFALSGSGMGSHALAAWPSAEIGFMDPQVGVNVVHAGKLANNPDAEAERQRLIAEWSSDTGPEGAAGIMELDEIIDPAETRAWLRRELDRLRIDVPRWGERKPLAYWPTCY